MEGEQPIEASKTGCIRSLGTMESSSSDSKTTGDSQCPPASSLAGGRGKKMFQLSKPCVETEDRLSALPEDILCRILTFIDARSLLRVRGMSTQFRRNATLNASGWDNLCVSLWKDKIHVSPAARSAFSVNSLEAYKLSVQDSLQRDHISREELCFDAETMQGTVWSFRFKESAGSDWTVQDPWFNGMPCRKMVFLVDGTVQQYETEAPTGRAATIAAAVGSDSTTSSTLSSTMVHPRLVDPFPRLVNPPMTMTWRFLTRPMDLPTRAAGSYIRFSVGGRDVPTYSVRRSPTGNWGFIMESCWGVYASFELPPRKFQRRQRRRILRRSEGGAIWIDDPQDADGDDYNAGEHGERSDDGMLQDDSSLLITNEVQWREAFLYNVGARVLPEGDEATDEFDRAWGGL